MREYLRIKESRKKLLCEVFEGRQQHAPRFLPPFPRKKERLKGRAVDVGIGHGDAEHASGERALHSREGVLEDDAPRGLNA